MGLKIKIQVHLNYLKIDKTIYFNILMNRWLKYAVIHSLIYTNSRYTIILTKIEFRSDYRFFIE